MSMANFGMLREYRFTDASEDIRGSKLYGMDDEKLGKIDDVIFDYASGLIRYVVVDTGGWLSSKKFIVPANRLRASAKHDDDFEVSLTKEQIEAFPPYNDQDLESNEQWSDYEDRYKAKWKADPVMHRAETDRNITPTTQQMEGNLNSELASGSMDAARRTMAMKQAENKEPVDIEDTEFVGFAGGTDTVDIDNTAVGIGGRWDTFQDRLRERRKEVIHKGSTPESGSPYRKAS
jgi:hypothetical protein